MKDNKQKGLASLFITVVVLVFLGFLAYNVLTGGNSKSADSLAQSTETAVTNTDTLASSEMTESSSVDESSGETSVDESTISDETAEESSKT